MHNRPLYQRLGLGLNKQYFSLISSRDFAHLPADAGLPPGPPLAERLAASSEFRALPEASQASLLAFEENSFAILPGFLMPTTASTTSWPASSRRSALANATATSLLFALRQSARIRTTGEGALRALAAAVLGHDTTLFQSTNFLTGSEQRTHSNSIHMNTFPLSGMAAAWVALENITPGNGPLHYYSGSHRLPYYLNADYANEGTP